MRHQLMYDAGLSLSNTWRLHDIPNWEGCVETRIRVASALEVHVVIGLRRRAAYSREFAERSFIRCLDGDRWLIESRVHHDSLPRLELELVGGSERAQASLAGLDQA